MFYLFLCHMYKMYIELHILFQQNFWRCWDLLGILEKKIITRIDPYGLLCSKIAVLVFLRFLFCAIVYCIWMLCVVRPICSLALIPMCAFHIYSVVERCEGNNLFTPKRLKGTLRIHDREPCVCWEGWNLINLL